MAKRLKVDFNDLQSSIKTYNRTKEDFETVLKNLSQSIDNLKSTGWKSGASDAFFKTFDENWKKNMELHIRIVEHLLECLENANKEYTTVHENIKTLGNDL